MKLYGLFGKGSGKLGSSVFAISSGEQIVREYNPVVENPNTPAQVEQRAKFKLLSQLAADMASAIVIPKQGLVSSRNRFIGLNIGKANFADNKASISLEELDITAGSFLMGGFEAEKGEDNVVTASYPDGAPQGVTSVVYVAFEKDEEGHMIYRKSVIVENAGEGRTFSGNLGVVLGDVVVYAYGIKGDVAGALAAYTDYYADPASFIANVVATRSEKASSLIFSKSEGRIIEGA